MITSLLVGADGKPTLGEDTEQDAARAVSLAGLYGLWRPSGPGRCECMAWLAQAVSVCLSC